MGSAPEGNVLYHCLLCLPNRVVRGTGRAMRHHLKTEHQQEFNTLKAGPIVRNKQANDILNTITWRDENGRAILSIQVLIERKSRGWRS